MHYLIFENERASVQEIIAVRKLVEKFRNQPVSKVKAEIGMLKELDLGVLSSTETHSFCEKASSLNLNVVVTNASFTSYLPINQKTNIALIIENDALADLISQKMLDSGIPIISHTESC